MFISDSVCAFPYGHNPVGVGAFTDSMVNYFSKIIPLVSRELPYSVLMPPDTDRAFRFYYRDRIKLPNSGGGIVSKLVMNKKVHRSYRRSREVAISNFRLPLIKDPMRAEARSDWRRIFKKYSIDKSDVIFFPCGDYYSVRGLFHFLKGVPHAEWPLIHVHLIHVMENECAAGGGGVAALYGDLLSSGVIGHRVFLSAEVPAYAEKLSSLLFTDVAHFTFPPKKDLQPLYEKEYFQVSAVGSGRGDKGYFRLANIAENYANCFPESNVRFVFQAMSPAQPEYDIDYEARLSALSNVQLYPHQLDDEQMHNLYVFSDLLILPYCRRTYRFRGSAVMSEGYGYGRPMLVTAGTAFEGIVKRFGNGAVCDSDFEFAEAISRYSALPKAEANSRAIESRDAHAASYGRAIHDLCIRLAESGISNSTLTTSQRKQ